MSTKRDYYEILGTQKSATLEEIKRAYRELALRYHPDRVSQDQKKDAEEKFKEISEAYAVLSDSQKRALYDQYGHSGIDQRYAYEDIFKGADFSSVFEGLGDFGLGGGLFDEIFQDLGYDIFGSSSKGRSGRRRRGRDLQITVAITLEEAATGIEKTIAVPRHEVCPACSGTGAKPGTKKVTCLQCKGTGHIVVSSGFFHLSQPCPRCAGQGSVVQAPCTECRGEGRIKVTRRIKVKIPKGVDNGSHLRIRGEGEGGSSVSGDLYVIIEVRAHHEYQRHGNDIVVEKKVSLPVAVLGGETEVQTLHGKVKMKIPSGTQSGSIFRIRDKGMPEIHGRGFGDELVKIEVVIPANLNAQQRRLMEEFARACGEDVAQAGEGFGEKIKKVFK
ncbi:MAG: molecular chaperone DnaJ [Candidatus Omnitrophota bacterium]|jgi:molecular chaperone DnaJ|nr:MAG: molecular chaperone DnaJ [Candidatus Omnitrophota bacterium]